MHYCLLLVTKEIPSESRISKILQPYDEENLECNKIDTDCKDCFSEISEKQSLRSVSVCYV